MRAQGHPLLRRAQGAKRAGRLRDRFADIWHVLAVIYMAAIFGVWVLGIEGGFQYFAIRQEVRDRFPTLEERANGSSVSGQLAFSRTMRIVI